MFPIRDSIPRVHLPVATWTIIGVNALFFLYQLMLGPRAGVAFLHVYGVVPFRFLNPEWAALAGYPPGGTEAFLSHMFLHGGWMHFIVNMWTLWIFADNIEDVMGPVRFVLFYLLCGLAALAAHVMFNTGSTVPVVGASGAIAGVMGAYFLLYPHAQVLTLIPIFFIPYFINLPAVLYLGIWFATQLFSGLSTVGESGAGVAWWAHAGGFLAGLVLLPLFRRRDRCYYCYSEQKGRTSIFPPENE